MRNIGRLNDQAHVRRFQIDDITFTYVTDGPMTLAARKFLPDVPESYWRDNPDSIDGQGNIAMTAGGLLVQYGDTQVMIDAGLGPIGTVNSIYGPIRGGSFPDNLRRLGISPQNISHFLITHIHIDHVGWAFITNDDRRRVPFFSAARYVIAEQEWSPVSQGIMPVDMPDPSGIVEPLLNHSAVQRVADGGQITDRISVIVTPGHTPGHASYIIQSSTGNRVIAFGDAYHAPLQLHHPEWGSAPDSNTSSVMEARRIILSELLKPNTYAFAAHFGDQPFGQVVMDTNGRPVWEPIPTDQML